MGQGGPIVDFPALAAAASHYGSSYGSSTDHAAQQFLEQYPLPLIFRCTHYKLPSELLKKEAVQTYLSGTLFFATDNLSWRQNLYKLMQQKSRLKLNHETVSEKGCALERGSHVPGLESVVVACLEKIFSTNYGLSLLPQALPYAVVGFGASSPLTRRLTCFAIGKMLENAGKDNGYSEGVLAHSDAVSPLIFAVADCDTSVAAAAGEAVMNLAKSRRGLELIFLDKGAGASQLIQMASHESALIRIRALSIAGKIFGLSELAASTVQQAGILQSLEDELTNSNDILAQINALELVAEVSETPNGAMFLLTGNLIGHLTSTIENSAADSLVRCRAMVVGGRLLSSYHSLSSPITDSDATRIVAAIDKNLRYLKSNDIESSLINEQEVALDSFGQIGTSSLGAEILLSNNPPFARHIVDAAFRQRGGGLQLAAVHALASLGGSERTYKSPLLNEHAESCLHNLIYAAAAEANNGTPGDFLWSLLKQAPEIRVAAYRLIGALAARSWILWEICSHQDLVKFIADPQSETLKDAMDWRHACCVAVASALCAGSDREQFPTEVVIKLDTAAKQGPYPTISRQEVTPIVSTMDRF